MHNHNTPTRFFRIFEKIQNGRLLAKKQSKNGNFWAQCVSRRPAKTMKPSYFMLWYVIIPYNGIMHTILKFWKNPKWPTYADFKIPTFGLVLPYISKTMILRRLILGSRVPFMTMPYLLGQVTNLSEVAFFQNGRFFSKITKKGSL